MEKLTNISWARLTVESAAIVTSILLAFGIDAWWTDRQQRVEEHLILGELLEEFQEKKSVLDMRIRYNTEIQENTNTLLSLSRQAERELTSEEMDRYLYGIYWFNTHSDWDTPVLQSLINSGNLSLISNPSLRTSLAKWPARFDQIRQSLAADRNYFTRILDPFIIKNTNMLQFESADQGVPGRPEDPRTNVSVIDYLQITDHRFLLDNQEFENILFARTASLNDILTFAFHDVDVQLDSTIRLIEAELAK